MAGGRFSRTRSNDSSSTTAGGRSSTSSHLSKQHETATAGTAERDFRGILLNNDLASAGTLQLAGLTVLLLVLIFVKRPKRSDLVATYWVAALLVSVLLLREVTWIPLLTSIIYTRTSYPYLVVIPHCIVAAASYRSLRGDQSPSVQSLGLGFICWGFGGSIVSDVLMGLPATALGHARIIPSYLLGWLLVWYSPADIVYRHLSDRQSFVHHLLIACEAVDSVTTPMGRISRAARELNNKFTAPLAAGLLAGVGGGILRTVVLEGEKAPLYAALETGVWKTLGYSLLWWFMVVHLCEVGAVTEHCDSYNGTEELRVGIVCFHIVWTLACDLGYASGHPFLYLAQALGKGFSHTTQVLRLGPAQAAASAKKED